MKRLSRILACAATYVALSSLVAVPPVRADSFTVEQWDLGVSVYHEWPDVAGEGFLTVTNPFSAGHQVSLPSSPQTSAAAEYDISWLTNYGTFDIAGDLQLEGVAGGSEVDASSSGFIYITTHSDLTVTVDAAYTFDLPVGMLSTKIEFFIQDVDSHEVFIDEYQSENTFGGQPQAGTFTMTGEAILPADRAYIIRYRMRVIDYGPSGALTTGSGFVNFTITPEPSTLALLAGFIFIVPRHRHRLAAVSRDA